MRFPGKRACWWYAVLLAITAATVFSVQALATEPGTVTAVSAAILATVLLLALSIQVRNDLTLGEQALLLRFGPLTRRIRYLDIRSVRRTRNPLASTATSIDRVAIVLHDGGMWLVSARDNDRLIEELNQGRQRALRGD